MMRSDAQMKMSHGAGRGGATQGDVARGHMSDHTHYYDLNFRAIFQFMIGLAFVVVLCFVAMYGIFQVFEAEFEKNDPAPSPMEVKGWQNPGPEVQSAPSVQRQVYQAVEDSSLHAEGSEALAMPISRAMDLVVEEGLPYRKQPEGDDNGNESSPTDQE